MYGFDGSTWHRAEYELDDGFASVGLPVLAAALTRGKILATVRRMPDSEGGRPAYEEIDALIAADGEVDAGMVAALAPTADWDAEAGAAAARAFLAV